MERYIGQMPMMNTGVAEQPQRKKGLQKRTEQLGGNKYAEHYSFSIDDYFDDESILGQIG